MASFFIQNVLIQLESMASQGCQCHPTLYNVAHLYALCLFFNLSFIFFKLGYSCFTIMCMFLLYNEVNQLYIYIYIYTHTHTSPPSHSPSHSSTSSLSTMLCSLHYTACFHQQSFLYMAVHMSVLISQFLPPLTHHWVHMSIPYVCVSIAALKIHSSIPFF